MFDTVHGAVTVLVMCGYRFLNSAEETIDAEVPL
jgi:hypothetical protein